MALPCPLPLCVATAPPAASENPPRSVPLLLASHKPYPLGCVPPVPPRPRATLPPVDPCVCPLCGPSRCHGQCVRTVLLLLRRCCPRRHRRSSSQISASPASSCASSRCRPPCCRSRPHIKASAASAPMPRLLPRPVPPSPAVVAMEQGVPRPSPVATPPVVQLPQSPVAPFPTLPG